MYHMYVKCDRHEQNNPNNFAFFRPFYGRLFLFFSYANYFLRFIDFSPFFSLSHTFLHAFLGRSWDKLLATGLFRVSVVVV